MEDKNTSNNNEDNFFDRMDNIKPSVIVKKLQRSRKNVIIAGLCSGLGEYLNIDIAIIRLFAILSLLIGGWSITVYLIAAALLPKELIIAHPSANDVLLIKKENFKTVLSGILIFSGIFFGFEYIGIKNNYSIFFLPNGFVIPVIIIAVGVYLFSTKEPILSNKAENSSRLFFRSRKDKIFMGVCGGFADYIKTDSSSIRIILIIVTLLTLGLFAIIYFAFALLTKNEPESSFEFPQ